MWLEAGVAAAEMAEAAPAARAAQEAEATQEPRVELVVPVMTAEAEGQRHHFPAALAAVLVAPLQALQEARVVELAAPEEEAADMASAVVVEVAGTPPVAVAAAPRTALVQAVVAEAPATVAEPERSPLPTSQLEPGAPAVR